jgi:hypothetical protein
MEASNGTKGSGECQIPLDSATEAVNKAELAREVSLIVRISRGSELVGRQMCVTGVPVVEV